MDAVIIICVISIIADLISHHLCIILHNCRLQVFLQFLLGGKDNVDFVEGAHLLEVLTYYLVSNAESNKVHLRCLIFHKLI